MQPKTHKVGFPNINQLMKENEIPPSPAGYTGLLVAIYYRDLNSKKAVMAVFLNTESGYEYHYKIDEFEQYKFHLGRSFYLSVNVNEYGVETLNSVTETYSHDSQYINNDWDID